jgi:hypothetical protein
MSLESFLLALLSSTAEASVTRDAAAGAPEATLAVRILPITAARRRLLLSEYLCDRGCE